MSATLWYEPVEQVQEEICQLLDRYEAELPLPFPLKPDWEQYKILEQAGILRIVTARKDNELVGYVGLLLTPNIHNIGERVVTCGTLYVVPEHRGRVGIQLIREAEAFADGAKAVLMIASPSVQH